MGTLIDASVLIAVERLTIELDAAVGEHAQEPVGIATITAVRSPRRHTYNRPDQGPEPPNPV